MEHILHVFTELLFGILRENNVYTYYSSLVQILYGMGAN